MKPCAKYRSQIAFLVLGALNARETTAIREHLASCDACRDYRQEMASITHTLAAATPPSNLEPSPSFYRKLAGKLKPVGRTFSLADPLRQLRASLMGRCAALSVAAVFIALTALLALRPSPQSGSTSTTGQLPLQAASEVDPPPTIGIYQIAASQSLEKFFDLLTREGEKPLPPVPAYDLSSFELANKPP